ncbi:Response regulator of zinc sigma-54-dependent two-component system [Minicystis rosea]|nr:Response regulator of zinc sigma-54-dependent two-component system [Minicystis rosea]
MADRPARSEAAFDASVTTVLRDRVGDPPRGTFTIALAQDPARRLVIDGSAPRRLLIGKSSSCDLILDDPTASRRHCAIEIIGARLRVTDLGSSNGTTVEGIAIREAFLRGGETLTVGSTKLSVTHSPAGENPAVPYATRFGRLLGESRVMRRLYPHCARLAASRVPVLIEGETGTGKEVLAEALHEEGPLASAPFVVFDCTAVPASLLESELFGHERGSFTGATAARKGVFEQAEGGTLFIDEIGDLDLPLQSKLLRAIERGEVRRVGGDGWKRVDVRIMSATRRDLDREVQAGRFRDDLFHRLAVARIELPPLRARAEDIPLLAAHFHRQAGGDGAIPSEILARWRDEAWPGNVRELRNAVSRLVALGEDTMPPRSSPSPTGPSSSAGPDFIASVVAQKLPIARARAVVVEAFERQYLEAILAEHGGVVTRAAEASGIARRHFQRLRARTR